MSKFVLYLSLFGETDENKQKDRVWANIKEIKICFHFRTLAEFWHWFVANVPGTNVDDGQEIFQLLPPLVLPGAEGDHR